MRQCLMMTCIGFASGAIMFSYLIPLVLFHVDVREKSDDGNPGSSNVMRSVNVAAGIACMALDVAKAFVPVFVSVQVMGIRGLYLIPVTAAPVAGHAFSPMLRFKGGKSVSTTYGSLLGLVPLSGFVLVPAVVMAVFRFLVVIRPDSAGVIISMVATGLIAFLWAPEMWLKCSVALIAVIVTAKHVRHPDPGAFSVGVWHYLIKVEDKHLVFLKENG